MDWLANPWINLNARRLPLHKISCLQNNAKTPATLLLKNNVVQGEKLRSSPEIHFGLMP